METLPPHAETGFLKESRIFVEHKNREWNRVVRRPRNKKYNEKKKHFFVPINLANKPRKCNLIKIKLISS